MCHQKYFNILLGKERDFNIKYEHILLIILIIITNSLLPSTTQPTTPTMSQPEQRTTNNIQKASDMVRFTYSRKHAVRTV